MNIYTVLLKRNLSLFYAYQSKLSAVVLTAIFAFNPINVNASSKTNIVGTNDADVIIGIATDPNPLNQYNILGLGGNDLLSGAFGDDHILGGLGDDNISGEIPFLFNISTQDNDYVLYIVGDDVIKGNAGNDIISGEVDQAILGVNGADNVVLDASDITLLGSDIIIGGPGNDQLYGLFRSQEFLVINAENYHLTVNNPRDILVGGPGDDLLVGMVGHFVETWDNAINLVGSVVYNDAILDGNSGNDILAGDFLNWYFEATGPCSGTNIHTFGNDQLNGGPGNDLLIGDLETHITKLSICGNAIDQTEQYGEDELNGGPGNDTLVGDALNINVENAALIHASDTFVFSLDESFGNDTIKDLNAGGVADKLKFVDNHTLNTAEVDTRITSISANGSNDAVIEFDDGSSLTLEGVQYNGQSSIEDFGAIVTH